MFLKKSEIIVFDQNKCSVSAYGISSRQCNPTTDRLFRPKVTSSYNKGQSNLITKAWWLYDCFLWTAWRHKCWSHGRGKQFVLELEDHTTSLTGLQTSVSWVSEDHSADHSILWFLNKSKLRKPLAVEVRQCLENNGRKLLESSLRVFLLMWSFGRARCWR